MTIWMAVMFVVSMFVVGDVGAQAVPVRLREKPISAGHEVLMRGVVHAFTPDQVKGAPANRDCLVVITHGIDTVPPGFDEVLRYDEVVPVFVSTRRPVESLSVESFRRIVSGETKTWEALASGAGWINVYLHGGPYQKQSFESLLRVERVPMSNLAGVRRKYANDYLELATMSSGDESAFVVGLQKLEMAKGAGLKAIRIEGTSLEDREGLAKYPLRVPIRVFAKRDSATTNLVQEITTLLKNPATDFRFSDQ